MLATDFHIMYRKNVYRILTKKNHYANLFFSTMPYLFLILWKYVVFFNDTTNQKILQKIKKKTLIVMLKKKTHK